MEKIAVYGATRNLYARAMDCAVTALDNGHIDRIYILTEDDDVPTPRQEIQTINVAGQAYFDKDGPNATKRWTWMVLMKAALSQLFPELDLVLWLDCDTIVRGDVTPLWDEDLEGLYFAGVREPYWTEKYQRSYVNAGVLLFNLEKMRWIADKLIWVMNNQKFTFVEQDCLNYCCAGEFRIMDAAYNAGDWTEKPHGEIVIRHFMASKGMWKAEPEVRKYANMEWEEVFR